MAAGSRQKRTPIALIIAPWSGLALLFLLTQPILAQELVETTAIWKDETLVVNVSGQITAKQFEMVSGGFTTVSELALFEGYRNGEPFAPLDSRRCQVKFDAWEESYGIIVLKDHPEPIASDKIEEFNRNCMRLEITDQSILTGLATRGALIARLSVKQTSPAEAESIKDWLVKQQSGVIQSLFSHMLGEMSLNQSVTLIVRVPSKKGDDHHQQSLQESKSQQKTPEQVPKGTEKG